MERHEILRVIRILSILILSFFSVNAGQADVKRMTKLYWAMAEYGYKNHDLSQVRKILDAGVDVNKAILGGWTPLHLACGLNRPELVNLLIEHGADPEVYNDVGVSPLMRAVAWHADKVLPVLLEHASVHHRDARARSLLFVAVLSSDLRCAIQEHLQQAPDLHAEDPSYESHTSFFDILKRSPHRLILTQLFEHGARLDDEDEQGNTPYLMAQKAAQRKVGLALHWLNQERDRRVAIANRMRAFLMAYHPRIGQYSPAHILSQDLFQQIWQILRAFERFLK